MTPITERLARLWRRASPPETPLTIAFDVWHSRPAHPQLQRQLGANISMDEFHALFPNTNLWTNDVEYVWIFEVRRDELRSMSERLSTAREVIFVDEEGR